MKTLIGLVRDFVAAVIGLAIAFGANVTDEQSTGILLVVVTALALGSFVYGQFKSKTPEPPA